MSTYDVKPFETGESPSEGDDGTQVEKSFSFDIVQKLGVLSVNSSGWQLQVNRISYNGRPPKLDIRRFSPSGRMGKGLALSQEEEQALMGFLLKHRKEE